MFCMPREEVKKADEPKKLEPIRYLVAELEVDRIHHRAFRLQMPPIIQQMLDLYGWELIYAAYPISGKINRFIHIWRIPDETAVLQLMSAGALDSDIDPAGPPPVPSTPEERFQFAYREIQSLIHRTRHVLMSSLPHDPTFVGFQQLTILVDAEGEMFTIDHADLKKLQPWTEMQRMINSRNEKKSAIRALRKHGDETSEAWDERVRARAAEVWKRDNRENWDRLQELLDYGAAAGEVGINGSRSERELFFNLAELKPHSIYQEAVTKTDAPAAKPMLARGPKEDSVTDVVGKAVIIASPWGAIYRLDQSELQKLAKPVSDEQYEGTYRRVLPLVRAKVNIAAIPEQRDLIIGDGCQCFVINLLAFGEHPAQLRRREPQAQPAALTSG